MDPSPLVIYQYYKSQWFFLAYYLIMELGAIASWYKKESQEAKNISVAIYIFSKMERFFKICKTKEYHKNVKKIKRFTYFKVKGILFPALPIITQSNTPEIITVNILADFENALFPVWKWDHAMLISYSDLWTSFL